MNRYSFCEWIPILPWPVWPLAGHARLGQNTVVGSMTILLSWLCWGACQEEVCLDPRFLCNLTLPRFSVELPFVSCPALLCSLSKIVLPCFTCIQAFENSADEANPRRIIPPADKRAGVDLSATHGTKS